MLDEPRELLARAWLPLMPDDAPPNALRFVELGVFRTCWLPTLLAPVPRFKLMLPALGLLPRFAVPALGPDPRFELMLPALVPRLPAPPAGCWRAWFCRALFWRDCIESPRALPPYLLAVARSE